MQALCGIRKDNTINFLLHINFFYKSKKVDEDCEVQSFRFWILDCGFWIYGFAPLRLFLTLK
jgi:hypothetical protein